MSANSVVPLQKWDTKMQVTFVPLETLEYVSKTSKWKKLDNYKTKLQNYLQYNVSLPMS